MLAVEVYPRLRERWETEVFAKKKLLPSREEPGRTLI